MTPPAPQPEVESDVSIDTRGMLCPQPVLALARAAKELGDGIIEVLADDPAAESDIPAWCRMRSAELVSVAATPLEGVTRYLVRVGSRSLTGRAI